MKELAFHRSNDRTSKEWWTARERWRSSCCQLAPPTRRWTSRARLWRSCQTRRSGEELTRWPKVGVASPARRPPGQAHQSGGGSHTEAAGPGPHPGERQVVQVQLPHELPYSRHRGVGDSQTQGTRFPVPWRQREHVRDELAGALHCCRGVLGGALVLIASQALSDMSGIPVPLKTPFPSFSISENVSKGSALLNGFGRRLNVMRCVNCAEFSGSTEATVTSRGAISSSALTSRLGGTKSSPRRDVASGSCGQNELLLLGSCVLRGSHPVTSSAQASSGREIKEHAVRTRNGNASAVQHIELEKCPLRSKRHLSYERLQRSFLVLAVTHGLDQRTHHLSFWNPCVCKISTTNTIHLLHNASKVGLAVLFCAFFEGTAPPRCAPCTTFPSLGDAVLQPRPQLQHRTEPDQDSHKSTCLKVSVPAAAATERILDFGAGRCEQQCSHRRFLEL